MTLEPNTLVSHFKVLSSIGKGGMGEVYLAQDTELDRKVAIKFLSEDLSKDSEKVNRFIQEAKAASALNHPNILTVHEIGIWEDSRYIATEYIEGETLRDIIRRKESVPLNRILKIGIQVAEALSAAHRAGITHRDIKPENIMIRDDGYLKVLDFGLAKLTEKKNREDDISLEGETKALVKTSPGVVMGTANYMSPEQAQGKETDPRTDIWSFGVVLYELLSGRVPFKGSTVNHTIVSILETEPKLLENVPDELQRIIRKTLSKDMTMRYQTSGDLVVDLKNLRRELDIQGELERSVVPNRETDSVDGETAGLQGSSDETAVAAGQSTQNLTNTSSLEYAVTQAKSHKLATGVIALLLTGAIAAVSYFTFFSNGSEQIDSIAVMPFIAASGSADADYLADGITESIIYNLSKLPQLKVLPSSTVLTYKGKAMNAASIGNELGVRAVLLSRITQRGEEIDISTELIDTKQNKVIWGERYTRSAKDALSIQEEISKAISNRLRLRADESDQGTLRKQYTAVPEAYQEYLKGRFQFEKRSRVGIERSIEHFEKAIELDPNYAQAWSALGNSYFLLPQYSFGSQLEGLNRAVPAARKAVELNPDLAEARTSLAMILLGDWKIKDAEAEFRKALELDPNYATAHHWYGLMLAQLGKRDESVAQLRTALELEPLSLVINRNLGLVLLYARRFEEARAQFARTIEMDPNFGLAQRFSNLTYIFSGEYDKGIELLEKDPGTDIYSPDYDLVVAYVFAGKPAKARDKLNNLRAAERKNDLEMAIALLLLGDKEEGYRWLEKAAAEKVWFLLLMNVDPVSDKFKDDPKVQALMRRIGLID